MEHDTPHSWLARAAELDPRAPAIVMGDLVISYAELDHQVTVRAGSLARQVRAGEIVAVPVHIDTASVVEMLALMRMGAVVAPYASEPPRLPSVAPEGVALCLATSGSTGAPRIVPLSYGNLSAAVAASRIRLGNGPDDRWLAALPLHHIGGISVLLRSLEAGGAVVLSPFGAETVDDIDRASPTIASLVPTMAYRLLTHAPDTLADIGIVLTGGARLSQQLLQKAEDLGVSLIPTYGMTETASQIATAIPGTAPSSGDVVGPLLAGFSVTIRTSQGLAERGEVGVIEVDGPAVFAGYLEEPARSGAHTTADLGFIDSDGALGVIGRIDDVVVTGGENVSVARVALAIEGVIGVRDVVVVGVPDREWGTAICALVEVEPGTLLGDVIDELALALPHHAMPKRVKVGVVPLLSNGKHDVSAVQDRFGRE
jgi:O-succinylbenzoic acid--CoA ligase